MKLLSIILSVVVSASLDSVTLSVGDQTALHLQVTQDAGERVEFPVYGNSLQPSIEIVKHSKRDTTKLRDGRIEVRQDLTITSFEDSLFRIDPIPFVFEDDTLFTDALSLNVIQPFEVDTAQTQIFDVKDIEKAPIWWWGIIRWILLALGIAALATGIYYLVRFIRSRRKAKDEEPVDPELLRPAHEVAIEKLDKIKAEKIWQQGKDKEYQSELTDVIREYLSRRFCISAQEMTTDAILTDMRMLLADRKDLYKQLNDILRLADQAKFAKHRPLPDEHETSLRNAYNIVEQTIPAPEPTDDNDETDTDSAAHTNAANGNTTADKFGSNYNNNKFTTSKDNTEQ